MIQLVFLLIFSVFNPQHKFYLSLSEVNYSQEEASLQIAIKTFTDDLELALTHQNGQLFRFNANGILESDKAKIAQYLLAHFKVKLNGKLVSADYLGSEMQMDATWSYIEIKNVRKLKTLEIDNSILIDEFEDQVNIINLMYQNQTKSFIGNKENRVFLFEEK